MRVLPLLITAGGMVGLLISSGGGQTREMSRIAFRAGGHPLFVRAIKHGSVMIGYKGRRYYVDPAQLPEGEPFEKADAIFITHEHGDHCDPAAITRLATDDTVVIGNARSVEKLGKGEAMKNGDKRKVFDAEVEAVPAYNIERTQYHPKGRDNGYVFTIAGRRIYVAGDTEAVPEMKELKEIDVAFLPINLPYTMTPKDAAEAAKGFKPRILVPYHQGQSNPQEVAAALAEVRGIEVRVVSLP